MMTPEHWQHVQDLFHQALDLDPEERTAFLNRACDDPTLRAEVQALLKADAQPPSIFDTAQELTHTLDTDERRPSLPSQAPQPTHVGRRIGPYRLVREIGRGGMGTVYLAQRTDLDNDVAIKIVRGALDAPETVARFLHEQRLLARLEHPNIARLLDAGMTEEQIPYFVMDYVEGVSITDYCDARRLTISARLALFERVCQAVHYAHQNLIIHRDLKPANILVTSDGQVKLLDFGIAKLIEQDDEAEGLTRTGMRVMTPEYAAPEQVRGEAITTATDVYALGVLLYELMTGCRPYALRGRSLGEIERVICEEEPVKPSVVASRYPDCGQAGETTALLASGTIHEVRARNSDRLRRRLAGDLDVICLKALSKEPSRRYASAEALWEDIRRHLGGLPVVARSSTLRYRSRKFVRRHRAGMATAGLVVVLVAVLLGAFTLRLARERDHAQVEAAKTAQVASFLMGLFEASDPFRTPGDTLTSYELLARGVERVEELSEEPEVQAELLDVVGEVYERLEQYEKAESLLVRALTLRRAVLGQEHPDVAESLHNLAWLLRRKGDYGAAEPLFREALAIQRKLLGEEHLDVASTMNALATLLQDRGHYDEAEPLFRKALAMRRKLLGEEHEQVAISLNNLALLLWDKGDLDEAERLYQESLATYRKLLGEEHPYVATGLNNLALVIAERGDLAAAESLFRQALAMDRKLMGEEHPYVADDMNNLARVLRDKGDYDAAEPIFREALTMRRRLLGQEHPRVAISLHDLAVLLHNNGDYDVAEPLHQEALAMRRKLLGDEHPDVATSLNGLATLRKDRGDYEGAAPLYQEALTIFRKRFGEADARVQEVGEKLVDLYTAWGKPEQAALYREQLRTFGAEQQEGVEQ